MSPRLELACAYALTWAGVGLVAYVLVAWGA